MSKFLEWLGEDNELSLIRRQDVEDTLICWIYEVQDKNKNIRFFVLVSTCIVSFNGITEYYERNSDVEKELNRLRNTLDDL